VYAKQYEITLPADYDMAIIRKRVADYGHLLDERAGLGLKAYLIREKGVEGSPVNEYAPFYLWNEVGAMSHFLVGGGGFQGIVRDFGRPTVRQWTGVARFPGGSADDVPRAASRRQVLVPADTDGSGTGLAEWVAGAVEEAAELSRRSGAHTVALAVDVSHWRLLEFALWADAVPGDVVADERYQVLHLSQPGIGELPIGRCW
jgi:hypothetical protein